MMSCWVKMEEEFGFGFGWEKKDMRRRRIVEEWRKGPWSGDEDKLLTDYVRLHGEGRWNCVARLTGLKRNGKSCRLRWVNYLRPDLKRSQITPHEETIILDLHARWGNRWSTIARSLPGRTDNEIKNYWRTHFKNKSSTIMPLTPYRRNSHDKIKARLLLKKQQFQQQSEDMKISLWQQQQQQLDDQTSKTQSYGTTLPAADPPVEMPTSYDYSTLILGNIPQLQHDDDMFWDTVSLWNQLQEIDLYATQSSSTPLHQTHSSFSL